MGSLEVCLHFRLGCNMAVHGSLRVAALEFLSVIIESWGRGGGAMGCLYDNYLH